jgi:hypothetical protein
VLVSRQTHFPFVTKKNGFISVQPLIIEFGADIALELSY